MNGLATKNIIRHNSRLTRNCTLYTNNSLYMSFQCGTLKKNDWMKAIQREREREPHAWNWIHWNYRIVKMWASANIVNENKTHIRALQCVWLLSTKGAIESCSLPVLFAKPMLFFSVLFFFFVGWFIRLFVHSMFAHSHMLFRERSLFRCIYIFMSFHNIGFEMFIEMLALRPQYFRIIY